MSRSSTTIQPLPLRTTSRWAITFHLGLLLVAGMPAWGEEVPAWQRGLSTWNGRGYDLPWAASPVADAPTEEALGPLRYDGLEFPSGVSEPASRLPYTMPVDPSGASLSTNPGDTYTSPGGGSLDLADPRGAAREYGATPSFEIPTPPADDFTSAGEQLDLSLPTGPDDHDDVLPVPVDAEGTLAAEGDTTSLDEIETLGVALDSENGGAEAAPLRDEVTRWYQYPIRWMQGWDSNAEFGLDGSEGNANTLAIQTGLELKRQTDTYTLSIDADYRQAMNRSTTTEDNGRVNVDFDRLIHDTNWSGFGKFGMEWDRFKAFDLRLNVNGGLGYYWIRDDETTLVSRFGAGASREIGSPVDDWIPEAVFGLEAEHQLTRRQKLKGKVDYFPAWEDFSDYRIVTDLSWEILLDGSENLSLKLAATDRYDSTPQGAKPNDLYYSMLLLYKF